MISQQLAAAIADQMVFELYSSYIYLGLAAGLDKLKLPGAAHWMRMQSEEELIHANLFFDYLTDQGADITLAPIGEAPTSVATPKEAFEKALAHEKKVTERIRNLCAIAMKDADFASLSYLNWFITEQVQEEKSVSEIIDKFEFACDAKPGLLFIDKELSLRAKPTVPAIAQGE